jgi:hypothetical protein
VANDSETTAQGNLPKMLQAIENYVESKVWLHTIAKRMHCRKQGFWQKGVTEI